MIKQTEKFDCDIKRAAAWLRAIQVWLLETNNDMVLPDGTLDDAPEDIAEQLEGWLGSVKDADRYRWLRDISVPPHQFYISVPDEFHGNLFKPSDIDTYIDSALEYDL